VQIIDPNDVPHDFRSLEELETMGAEESSKPTMSTLSAAEENLGFGGREAY
jgi:hypothetical protein